MVCDAKMLFQLIVTLLKAGRTVTHPNDLRRAFTKRIPISDLGAQNSARKSDTNLSNFNLKTIVKMTSQSVIVLMIHN